MRKYISKLKEVVLRGISKVKLWFRREPELIIDPYSPENIASFIHNIEDVDIMKVTMLMLAEKMGAKVVASEG